MATRGAIRIALSRRVKQLRVDLTCKRRTDLVFRLGAKLDRDQVLGPRPQTVADVVAGDDESGAVLRDTSHPLAAELGAGRLGDECEAQDLACERRIRGHAREETRTTAPLPPTFVRAAR